MPLTFAFLFFCNVSTPALLHSQFLLLRSRLNSCMTLWKLMCFHGNDIIWMSISFSVCCVEIKRLLGRLFPVLGLSFQKYCKQECHANTVRRDSENKLGETLIWLHRYEDFIFMTLWIQQPRVIQSREHSYILRILQGYTSSDLTNWTFARAKISTSAKLSYIKSKTHTYRDPTGFVRYL